MMEKIVNWLAGIETDVDSKVLSFRNRRHTGVKLLAGVLMIFLCGMIVGLYII